MDFCCILVDRSTGWGSRQNSLAADLPDLELTFHRLAPAELFGALSRSTELGHQKRVNWLVSVVEQGKRTLIQAPTGETLSAGR